MTAVRGIHRPGLRCVCDACWPATLRGELLALAGRWLAIAVPPSAPAPAQATRRRAPSRSTNRGRHATPPTKRGLTAQRGARRTPRTVETSRPRATSPDPGTPPAVPAEAAPVVAGVPTAVELINQAIDAGHLFFVGGEPTPVATVAVLPDEAAVRAALAPPPAPTPARLIDVVADAIGAPPAAPTRAARLPSEPGSCTNYAPAGYAGHWRDWHRGHGCNLDPGPEPAPAPELAAPAAAPRPRRTHRIAAPVPGAPPRAVPTPDEIALSYQRLFAKRPAAGPVSEVAPAAAADELGPELAPAATGRSVPVSDLAAEPVTAAPAAPPLERQPPAPPAVTRTGVACRVCNKDDGDDRVQVDLHRRCMESATNRAIARRAARRRPPAPAPSRMDLIAQLARARAGGAAETAPKRGGRAVTEPDQDGEDEVLLTAEESAAVSAIQRGGGLSTVGLGGSLDDA